MKQQQATLVPLQQQLTRLHKEAQALMDAYNSEKESLTTEEEEAEQVAEDAIVETIMKAEQEARDELFKEEEAMIEKMADGEQKQLVEQALEVAELKAEAAAAEEQIIPCSAVPFFVPR